MRRLLLLAAAATLVAEAADAQVVPSRFTVGTHLGYTRFDKGTGYEDAPFLGVDGTISTGLLKGMGADLGIGFTFTAARPVTAWDQFAPVAFDFGDTTLLYGVAQRTTLLTYGLQGTLGFSAGVFRLYGLAGAGAYTIQLDSRQNVGNKSSTNGMFQFGGGIGYAISRSIGLRLEARDVIFNNFDRDRLDPTVGYAQDRRIVDAVPNPRAKSERPNNIQGSLVFSYVPNRRGTTVEEVPK